MKPGEEEITYVKFVEAVRVNRMTETYVDTKSPKFTGKLTIGWHPKGVVIESSGPKVVIPAANIAWVEVK
jgi:hypothetical protein